jgi:hypothetical protein
VSKTSSSYQPVGQARDFVFHQNGVWFFSCWLVRLWFVSLRQFSDQSETIRAKLFDLKDSNLKTRTDIATEMNPTTLEIIITSTGFSIWKNIDKAAKNRSWSRKPITPN